MSVVTGRLTEMKFTKKNQIHASVAKIAVPTGQSLKHGPGIAFPTRRDRKDLDSPDGVCPQTGRRKDRG